MNADEVFKIATAIIGSVGGSALILAAFSSWLGKVWAERVLGKERAKNSEALAKITKELDLIKQKELTRHLDKLAIYKDVVHMISEILRELEAVILLEKRSIDSCIEHSFSLNRNKIYGYISLVSTQEVMNKYNEMIDFLLPVISEGKKATWDEVRFKADELLNAMRADLGIKEDRVVYQGER